MIRTIPLLFFVSGFVALLYEILWIRELGYIFGASSAAISTVVAAYLGGLASGAWIAGQQGWGKRRGLLFYAVLEIGIAITGPLVPWAVRFGDRVFLDPVWDSLSDIGLAQAARFLLALVVMWIPTALMGATLPILCTSLVDRVERPGEVVGRLYGWNTLGGVLGCFAAGFFFIESLGLSASLMVAAAGNGFLVMAALLLHMRDSHESANVRESGQATPTLAPPGFPRQWILLAVFVTSFTSIGFELIWSRIIALAVGGTVYAFSTVLGTFLLGLGLGSLWIGARLKRRACGPGVIAVTQGAVVAWSLLTLGFHDDLTAWVGAQVFAAESSFLARGTWCLGLCFLLCLLPSFFMGVAFPLLSELWIQRRDRIGAGVGAVYLISTLGGVTGSAAATFFLAPAIGLQHTLWTLTVLSLGVAALFSLGPASTRRKSIPAVLVGSAVAGVFLVSMSSGWASWDPVKIYGGVSLYGPDSLKVGRSPLSVHDGSAATVVVFEADQRRSLAVNGKVDGSNAGDMATQLLVPYLPQLFHPDPKEVFILGYGTGVSAGAAARFGSNVVCAEIEQGVLDASRYFSEVNFNAHQDSQVQLRCEDGRSLLRRSPQQFDVIATEPSNPWMAGISNLFTREFYELCESRLAPDGVVCQFIQLYWISPDEYRAIVATMNSVFPAISVFRSTIGDTLLLGSRERLSLDFEALESRLRRHPKVARDLSGAGGQFDWNAGGASAYFSALLILHGSDVDQYVQGQERLVTDDEPFLEFTAARRMRTYAGPDILGSLLAHRQAEPYGRQQLEARLPAPALSQVRRYLASEFRKYGQPQKARKVLDSATRATPNQTGLAFDQWLVQRALSPSEALAPEALEQVARRDAESLLRLSTELSKAGEHELAAGMVERHIREFGETAEAWEQRGDNWIRRGDRQRAGDAYQSAQNKAPGNARLRRKLEDLRGD